MNFDITIIGAGPAGLTAAIFAAKTGTSVCIVEKNTSAGRKLLRTGRGRCNLTHTGTVNDFLKVYGKTQGRFLKHCLYEFSPGDSRAFFSELGVATKVEADGCVFPVSDRATDVCQGLIELAKEMGVTFFYGKTVEKVYKTQTGFRVVAGAKEIEGGAIIIATGGVSWPQTGSTGDGYTFAKELGHTIVPALAGCVGLVVAENWTSKLQGVAVGNVKIAARLGSKKVYASGPVMFTGKGIGGPGVFDLSREITRWLADGVVEISIDLAPEQDHNSLVKLLVEMSGKSPKKDLGNILAEILPKSLTTALCQQLSIDSSMPASQLPKKQRNALVNVINSLGLKVTATRPIAEATITKGGVTLNEIDPKTMQSKITPGVYFAGEVVDADGPCGGYNLQIAWSTGALAGKNAAEDAKTC